MSYNGTLIEIAVKDSDGKLWYSVSRWFYGPDEYQKALAFMDKHGASYSGVELLKALESNKDVQVDGARDTQELYERMADTSFGSIEDYLVGMKVCPVIAAVTNGSNGPPKDEYDWQESWMGMSLPRGAQNESQEDADKKRDQLYCAHEWVDVGFHHSFYVCKKCDKKKEAHDESY